MATVKMNQSGAAQSSSPSTAVIAAAVSENTIHDARGRAIVLGKPGPLEQYRLVEAAGESAGNSTYMSMILPLIYVKSIEGAIVPNIHKKAHIEALIQRLDDDCINAVMKAVSELYGSQDPEADKATLKN